MAYLRVIQGDNTERVFELTGDRSILGRHPQCEIVLDNAAVSRHHAQVLQNHGRYYVEDLRSRNGTRLNSESCEGRQQLHDDDEIRICDFKLTFCTRLVSIPVEVGGVIELTDSRVSGPASGLGSSLQTLDEPLDDVPANKELDSSSIVSSINTLMESGLQDQARPQTKLQAVLQIGRALSSTLDMQTVLERTLDSLFEIFTQADEGYTLLREVETNRLIIKAVKSRSTVENAKARISTTIIKRAMRKGEAILSSDVNQDKRFDSSKSISSLSIKSMMCVPLIDTQGESLGVMQINTSDIRAEFTKDDLELMSSVGAQVSLAIENAVLHEELLAQRDMQRDLEFATQIQLGFLPSERPRLDGYELYDYYEAAMRVGGDYFDYIVLPGGRVAIALGDVAGKGVPAALLMARLFSSARFHLLTQFSLADAMAGLNTEIASSGLGHRFITFVAIILDTEKNSVTIANAGHMPPVLREADGTVSMIGQVESGMPLGVTPSQVFEETVLEIQPGSSLLIYTDGITEAMNIDNDIYGRERLEKYIATAAEDAQEQVKGLIADMEEFCDERAQRDDICLVCLKRLDA